MSSYHHGNLRPALIEAGTELARLKGPEGVVLREVARRTGVSHNAAYRHFADREALLAEIAEQAMAGLAAAMRRRLALVPPGEEIEQARQSLREVGRAYVEFALAEPGLFAVAFAVTPASEVQEQTGEAPTEGPYALLGSVLDRLVAAGVLDPERREAAQVLCWATVHGFATLHLDGPLRDVPAAERERHLTGILDLVERGLIG